MTDREPLAGRTIVVTRAASQAGALTARLEAAGARIVEVPTIAIEPPPSWAALDSAIESLHGFTWVIFTSTNAVAMVDRRLVERRESMQVFHGRRIAAVGAATAAALRARGLEVDALPGAYRAEALVERLRDEIGPGDHVLVPGAAETRDVLRRGLESLGAAVSEVPVYVTRRVAGAVTGLLERLVAGEIAAVTFTSPSTAHSFASLFTAEERQAWAPRVRVASIGPVTRAAAAECGLETTIMPEVQTIDALARAIVEAFAPKASVERER
jgi:uroporphyrinogen III methyltransferase / synthase